MIDLGTLRKYGLDNQFGRSSAKPLINAAGDKMKILGPVIMKVKVSQALMREIKIYKFLIL